MVYVIKAREEMVEIVQQLPNMIDPHIIAHLFTQK